MSLQFLLSSCQLPPRLNIPGAVLLQNGPRPLRPHREGPGVPVRIRKPVPNALPISIPIREDIEENDKASSFLDDEVAKFSLQPKLAVAPDNDVELPRPVQFRPERPIPVRHQDLGNDEEQFRPAPPQIQHRQQSASSNKNRQQKPRPQPQQQQVYHQPRPIGDDQDDRRVRNRKPPVQILRKYRTDNDDGSITWGFENEDGTFKEETIGIDCVIRGKYGYVDPEGTRREYSYEAGNKCEPGDEELLEDEPVQQQQLPNKLAKKQFLSKA